MVCEIEKKNLYVMYVYKEINSRVVLSLATVTRSHSFDLTNTSNLLPWAAHHLSASASASYPNKMSLFVLSAH